MLCSDLPFTVSTQAPGAHPIVNIRSTGIVVTGGVACPQEAEMLGDVLKFLLGAVALGGLLLQISIGGFDRIFGPTDSSARPRPAAASARTPSPAPAFGDGPLVIESGAGGRFIADVLVQGARARMVVDTGASAVALTAEDAERAGIFPPSASYDQLIGTANGVVKAAKVELSEISLGQIRVRGVEAYVLPPGATNISLLGMTFLRRLSGFQLADNKLVLKP
jgi:aspartyl protease family protein